MKIAPEAEELITSELKGLIAMANQAKRVGVGDFIWFSWSPTSRKGQTLQPSFGTNLVGCTPEGATIMRQKQGCSSCHCRHMSLGTHPADEFIQTSWGDAQCMMA